MAVWEMHWPDKVHPYVRTTQRQKFVDPRYKKYSNFKRSFRLWANTQGFPEDLDPEKTYSLVVNIHLKGKATCDLDNQAKSIMDSAFPQDRRILNLTISAWEHSGRGDCASVILREIIL